jgi:hypothetical protein
MPSDVIAIVGAGGRARSLADPPYETGLDDTGRITPKNSL